MITVKSDCRGMDYADIIDTIMTDRKIENFSEFLNPTEDDILPYNSMGNIDTAREILFNSINQNESIMVLADTDCDGVSAGAIMTRYIKRFTDNVKCVINEGKAHGLVGQDLSRFKADLLIIVDSLDSDINVYKTLSDKGMKIIVLDHHKISPNIDYDKYVCLVSSQRDYNNPALSGAGVVWKFCMYCDKYYGCNYAKDYADLATCGIIADVMDMTSMENRAICDMGFANIQNLAIKKIVGSFEFNSTAVSFSIAPLINAANRMNENEIALQTFLCDDINELKLLMKQLKSCKEKQNGIADECLEKCEVINHKNYKAIMIDTEADIAGLLGNKFASKYQQPVLIIRKDSKGNLSGSGRGYDTEDFMAICESCGCWCGGHENAFGVKINANDSEKVFADIDKSLDTITKSHNVSVDIEVNLEDLTYDLIDRVKAIDRISGEGFKPIRVLVRNVDDYEIGNMSKGKHLVITSNGISFIKWNWIGDFNEMEDNAMIGEPLAFVGTLDSGCIGRKFMLKFIVDEMMIGE